MCRTVLMILGLVVVASAGLAQMGPPEAVVGPAETPMMRMMGAADIAAWNGSVYLLRGDQLLKLGPDLKPVKAVELPNMPRQMGKMVQCGMCPMCGTMRAPEARRGGGMGMGMGMGRGKGGGGGLSEMQRMHGMHTMQMMGRAEVEADAKGVYLLRGGELTVYDHDLNKVSTTVVCEVTGDCSNCPVCRGMMQQRKCGVGCMMHEESEGGGPRGEMGGGSCSGCRALARSGRGATPPGKALVRAIASGSVSVMHAPAVLTVGEADLHVHVDGVEGKGDAGAAVSAFVYPVGSPDAGKVAAMERVDPGRFMGTMALGAAGAYDLAVRVKRPGHSDEVVYFALRVSG